MNGIIIINKSKEYTSHDVVSKLRKILKISKVGHTGTLDPNATGVLPILIGQGTKLSKYLINHDKEYEVVLRLGEKTDTADCEGNLIETKKVDVKQLEMNNIKLVLEKIKGKQKQIPPMYSAIKLNGKKLYEYARKGQIVDVQPRDIEIYNIELIKIQDLEISFRVECSKGTYIRTLCENIAEQLKTVGYMKELKRTKVGEFDISKSITIDELEENKDDIEFLNTHIIKIEELLKSKEKVILNENKIKLFLNGVNLKIELDNDIYLIYNEFGKFIGTGIINDNLLKRDVVI